MVLGRVAHLFSTGDATNSLIDDDGRRHGATAVQAVELPIADTTRRAIGEEVDDEEARPPYLHVRLPSPAVATDIH